ncbi:OpgC domain-containing protein [Rhizobiaceae bacterium BDR2-2]|uniref:OpgC domain-containing protein n=1 Tax=Ectorhizobium quercum TaxID=2965071 RepID=A0AAE3MYA5_9HYPH|nr:OpgC domain-containing protein [Ectorhizobium quercum]MCX8996552.1 OpgC domain-containing protein [Ectorhizobium quercum]
MKRLDIIDGMRGYFLVFMLINHLIFTGGYWLVEINHRQFAFVEDAQGFVFLSGLLTGMIYSRRMLKSGYAAGRDQIHRRVFELYYHAMAIILLILVAQLLLPGAFRIWDNWLGGTRLSDPLRLATIATFLFQPTFMDILPQYIIYMVVAPFAIRMCLDGRWRTVATISLLLWLAGQLGLQRVLTVPLDGLLSGGVEGKEGLRVSFNLLGWQIVFFAGIIAGALTSMREINWSEVFHPERTFLPKLALAICLFFMPLRILTAHGLMPEAVLAKFATMEIRADLGPVYLINLAAVFYGVTWLLIAGARHRNTIVQNVSAALNWLFTRSYLQLLGRHSLHVYIWHVVIVYFVFYIDGLTPELTQATKTVIAITGVLLLSLPALYRERTRVVAPAPAVPARQQG